MNKISIVIPNYNGQKLLEKYMPPLVENFATRADIVIVDDASSDDSVGFVRNAFPWIKLKVRTENGGFSAAVNDGINTSESELVVLLNNDVEVTPGFLDAIIPLFDDQSVFAVSPRILLPSRGNLDEGAKIAHWYHGMLYTDQRQGISDIAPILYATGCAAVYRRSMLEELGGFDEAYSPFYWEDVDLGYRAWKRGWKTLYQPDSAVLHQHSASTSKLNSEFISRIKARNALFFIWRNIDDKNLLRDHSLWLPLIIGKKAVTRDTPFLQGWKEAQSRKDEALKARKNESIHRKMADRDIFSTVGVDI